MTESQQDGTLERYLQSAGLKFGEWSQLVETIHDHAYGDCRTACGRPRRKWSIEGVADEQKPKQGVIKGIVGREDAYGELRHPFISRIIEQTKMGPKSVFVDLGSGVGNCVVQAALQAGSRRQVSLSRSSR